MITDTDDGINSQLSDGEARLEEENRQPDKDILPPLRHELFSADQRKERGRLLGQEHIVSKTGRSAGRTLARLTENAEIIESVWRRMVDDVTAKKNVTPVGEWLVDNYYVIEEQISLSQRHLPKKYLHSLPALANPELIGVPRAYDLAERIIAFGDGRVDVKDVSVIVSAYQEASPLLIGELWAVPIMLRLALIENIRRLAALADNCRNDREIARQWAESIIKAESENPKDIVLVLADMVRTPVRLSHPFVAEFKRRLQGRSAGLKLPLQWVEQSLSERAYSIEQAVNEENHRQAQMEVSMRNCVNSLRNLNVTDWSEFVETMSLVEGALRQDPADVYGKMDFQTRDSYRQVIERLAKKSGRSEISVAEICLAHAREARDSQDAPANAGHVGYHLVGDGARAFKRMVGFRNGIGDFVRDASSRLTLVLYLGAILFLTAAFTSLAVVILHVNAIGGALLYVLTGLLAACCLHVSIGLVNFAATLLVKPRALPRMDYSKGIPSENRTLVVTPVLLSGAKGVESLIRTLEGHFLNNRGPNIHFGLLTDFADAAAETMPGDAQLLDLAEKGVERLNAKYPCDECDNFYLFHRSRTWNEMERIWMGHERKRGKLEALNRYLRTGAKDIFAKVHGRGYLLRNVKYVITLDGDTVMARDSAWQMAGTMAHPLARPEYDEAAGRVVGGHGILQPRVDSNLAGANRSLYARMGASEIGIDPYTRASSDVYQDLFDEGSFIGKGIYDVEIFDRALGGRFPDNKILSHDLLEGCIMRSGLLNDVKLYEDPPATYLMDVDRRHRWIRGDWQIASYLFARERRRGAKETANPLTVLSQWKIFDNLRRSVTSPLILALLLTSLVLFSNPGHYVFAVLCVFTIPVVVNAFGQLVMKSPDKTFIQHLSNLASSTFSQAVQAVFKFACLPFKSLSNADAIVRSLWRQLVSRRLLLQWKPSDNSVKTDQVRLTAVASRMWIGPALAAVMTAILAVKNPGIAPYALPLFALWFFSPLVVSRFSAPRRVAREALSGPQRLFLRKAARRTWRFFETFVTAEENWLPPDNYQEHPVERIAHRTSPTNMGLSLLASLSACDFGFITAGKMLRRCNSTLATMLKLERFNGHLYNWYDTQTLKILRPAYVSTVDSGNLAAHLLVLASGLQSLPNRRAFEPTLFSGMRDTLELALDEAGKRGDSAILALDSLRKELAAAVASPPARLDELHRMLKNLADRTVAALAEFDARVGHNEPKTRSWLAALADLARDGLAELELVAPWSREIASHPEWANDPDLNRIPTLLEAGGLGEKFAAACDAECLANGGRAADPAVLRAAAPLLELAKDNAEERLADVHNLILLCEELANIEFDFLYDRAKRLLAIGYNVDERRLDSSFYDLLASEARLACYLGVARHQLPQVSWLALGRMLTRAEGRPLLVSWSGSMFEYLMPLLVMPTHNDTLLDETYKSAVSAQIAYGREKGVPWGISESGFHVFDADHNYQYRAFGVPELGLKHGLSEDLVISPYATALAAMVYPARACKNLERLAAEGCLTSNGFYEAVDYTSSRLPRGSDRAVIRSFMAHHQGMSLVAFGQALLDRPMHKRFEANPMLDSASLLLQEMVPAERALYYHSTYSPDIHAGDRSEAAPMRVVGNPATPQPEVQLLSNGNFHVMISAAGGGYSRFRDLAVTRWREDATMDNWGTFCYVRDLDSGDTWSNTLQPTLAPSKAFSAVFTEGKAEFTRKGRDIDTRTEITVSPEDDVEVRRIRVHNHTGKTKRLDATSFAEVALAGQNADTAHQAFSKLFVQTRLLRNRNAIVCSRRPRSQQEHTPLMFHMLVVHGAEPAEVSFETDRLKFVGRGNTAARPAALEPESHRLSDTEGAVLDPIVSIRAPITLGSGESVTFSLITGVADDEEKLNSLIEKYHDPRMADKAFDLAWTHGQLLLRQQNITETEAQLFCRLAGSIIYPNPAFRADHGLIMKNRKGQSGLWSYAISGDLPIMLVKVMDPSHMRVVDQLLQAHTYWRQKGLKVDLLIWNENQTSYRQNLHDQILGMAGTALQESDMEKPGGIFIRSSDRISDEDKTLMQAVARVVMTDDGGLLEEQMRRLTRAEGGSSTTIVQYRRDVPDENGPGVRSAAARSTRAGHGPSESEKLVRKQLALDNGLGGFSADGKEYVIITDPERLTPLPWVNVIANPKFGTVVSESGSSCTWAENSHEFRLTPWQNDPVSDSSGEAVYLRDEQTGEFWSPAPLPCRGSGRYTTRHGFGYSVFEHRERGINSEMTVYIDPDEPIKFVVLKIRNSTKKPIGLSAVAYAEWVLGDLAAKTRMHVITGVDSQTGALFARNQYNDEFRGRTAFIDSDDPARTVTGDRREFLGRNGTLSEPFALQRANLPGRVGPALDPCGAVQIRFGLAPGQERKIIFRIGVGRDVEDARRLVKHFRGAAQARESLEKTHRFWDKTLSAVQVETPDPAFNALANGWLVYQTLSCRFWGRNATYQSGGAFGFRDQLQDSMALLYSHPELVRKHIIESAGRQFVEGDVMHWWHPPLGRGVRTRCSDDYLWLPYAVERYVRFTGDTGVLDEEVEFIRGRALKDGEESYYDLPSPSGERARLYEHCRRAIRHGLRFGAHGMPLMGSGDWNDGMDLVGIDGKGESVWLGFFLHTVLANFAGVAERRNDTDFAALCRGEADKLAKNIENGAWDEGWYRRAYFDDGTPLGSAANPECRIDSLAQSWAVLSGAADPARAASAMRSLYRHLVDDEHKIVKLFEPAFDKWEMNPGYIKGYVPGVRENGGQYTHGAIWAAMAFARLKDRRKAWELFTILNPINHALTLADAEKYKVEPYVVSADVYAAPQHLGRGGWSWYTGSASWLYRFMLESLLGLSYENGTIRLDPCAPAEWDRFTIRLARGGAACVIEAKPAQGNGGGREVLVNGIARPDGAAELPDNAKECRIEIKY